MSDDRDLLLERLASLTEAADAALASHEKYGRLGLLERATLVHDLERTRRLLVSYGRQVEV